MRLKIIFTLLQETFQEWQKDKATVLASSLAYYTVFSLAPLLIIVLAITGAIFGTEAARGELVGQIDGLVGTEGAKIIETAIENANQPDIRNMASLINIVVLIFGATGVFVQLQDALNTIWQVKSKPRKGLMNFVRKRFLSFGAVLGIGFLLLVSLIINAVLSTMSNYMTDLLPGIDFLWQLVNLIISFLVITFLFALMYKYLPDVKITWEDVTIGAVITTILFTLGKYLLGLYIGHGSFGSTYGAAGSLVVILAWVYYSALILFFGAEFTQVYARRFGSQIIPNKYAVKVSNREY